MGIEYAPQELSDMYNSIAAVFTSAQFSGIVGDKAHTYGYHRARAVLPADDYSVQLPQDKQGDAWAASALDIKFTTADMKIVSSRLMAACKANDPRVHALREWYGTIDGVRVIGWDRHNPDTPSDDNIASSDDSHLWHVHLSPYRMYANNAAALNEIVAVITNEEEIVRPEDIEAIADAVWKKEFTSVDADGKSNSAKHPARQWLANGSRAARIASLQSLDQIADAVIAKLPSTSGGSGLTAEDVKTAIKDVLSTTTLTPGPSA